MYHQQLNMAWTNEDTFKFIQLYQNKPIIWNPKNKKHTDRNLVDEAWHRIADVMKIPVSVLKRKKKTLMTTFRFHYKKKQQTLRRYKPGSKHVYTPIWTFYEALEAFLKGVYDHKGGSKTKRKGKKKIKVEDTDIDESEQQKDDSPDELKNEKYNIPLLKRRSNYSMSVKEASREVSSAFHILNRIFKDKQKKNESKKQDDCELYGKLLAKKLRQFSENDRLDIMYELDGLLINRCLHRPPDSPPLQVIMKENPISASDSYASPSLSPTQSQEASRQNSSNKNSPESPQSDPLQSSSNSRQSLIPEDCKKEIDVVD